MAYEDPVRSTTELLLSVVVPICTKTAMKFEGIEIKITLEAYRELL